VFAGLYKSKYIANSRTLGVALSLHKGFVIFSGLLEHVHNRLIWNHEEVKIHTYLKIFMHTATLSI